MGRRSSTAGDTGEQRYPCVVIRRGFLCVVLATIVLVPAQSLAARHAEVQGAVFRARSVQEINGRLLAQTRYEVGEEATISIQGQARFNGHPIHITKIRFRFIGGGGYGTAAILVSKVGAARAHRALRRRGDLKVHVVARFENSAGVRTRKALWITVVPKR